MLLAAVVVAVYFVLRAYARSVGREERSDDAAPNAGSGGEDMVPCSRCGVHLPRSEAVRVQGALFCSEEHGRMRDQ